MTIHLGRASQRWISRLLIAALILTSPGFSCYQAFALTANDLAAKGRPAAEKPLALMPHAPAAGGFVAVPKGVKSVLAGKVAEPKAAAEAPAERAALLAAAGAAPALLSSKTTAADLRTGAAKGFETFAADRPALVTVQEPGEVPDSHPSLRPTRYLSFTRPKGVAIPLKISNQGSSWKQKFVSALPKLSVVAAVAGLGWIAHSMGKPEMFAGLLPALMMGTLSNDDGSSLDPTSAQVLKELAERIKPGETVSKSAQRDIAGKLGLTEDQLESSLLTLVEYNKLALLGDQIYLYSEVSKRKEAGSVNPALATGHAWALKGLAYLNKGNVVDHALALDAFFKAMKQYAAFYDQTRLHAPAGDDVSTLYYNARFELLRGVFNGYDQSLSRLEDGVAEEEERAMSRKAIAWLKDAYQDVHGHRPKPLDPELAEWMYNTLRSIKPTADAKENAADINHGLFLAQTYLRGEAFKDKAVLRRPMSGRRALVPKSGTGDGKDEKWFDLIGQDDKGYALLNEFGKNYARAALDGEFPPYVGGQEKLDEMAVIVGQSKNNNPILLGEPGVGKTALIQAFQQAIIDGKYPDLKDVNIYELDLAGLIAGTKYRGEFEQRLKGIIDEVKNSKGRVMLAIDEIHTVVAAGAAEGAMDAAQILKGPLVAGQLRVIGATTLDEYRKYIEKDGALTRRFGAVIVPTPSLDEATEIVKGSLSYYEKAHRVKIPAALARNIVELADRYVRDESLPASAFKLLDRTGSRMKLHASQAAAAGKTVPDEMTLSDLLTETTLLAGQPVGAVGEDQYDRLRIMFDEIVKHIVGQDEVVRSVVNTVIRASLGLKDPRKPNGIFLFMGPTGVGKTELAKAIAKFLFGSEKNLIKIGMQNYAEKHSQSGLIGAPPGYVGYEEAGQLTEQVRRHPYSVVLLDEIEKAHPDIYNTLLSALDEGEMKDSQGRKASFKNTVIIMTSNLGTREVKEALEEKRAKKSLGFAADQAKESKVTLLWDEIVKITKAALSRWASPEFINRTGWKNIFIFRDLEREHLRDILNSKIVLYNRERLAPEPKRMQVSLTDAAKNFILDQATTEENAGLGARPLEQTIDQLLGDAIAKAMLDKTKAIKAGDRLVADYDPASGKLVAAKQPE